MNFISILAFLFSFGFFDGNLCEIINNRFASTPFKNGKMTIAELEKILAGNFIIDKSAVKNQFSVGVDTLITYKADGSEFVFYKGPESTFLYRAIVENKRITFIGDFQIGDHRPKVNQKLNFNYNDCQTIIVTDDEHFSKHHLIFEQNRLVKVILNFGLN